MITRTLIHTTRPRWVLMAGTLTTTTIAASYYVSSTHHPSTTVLGVQRQFQFWRRVFPVVMDYYWHFGKRSPRVYLQREERVSQKELQQELHHKHAPEMLQVMLDLKGLYVKLGQVLSVAALPLPAEYRDLFRTLQSDVPGYEEFSVVQEVLKEELGTQQLESVFSYIDPVPCGAASIGQAHRAVLVKRSNDDAVQEEVIIKVQYPDAAWQVPADIQCIGNLLQICVWTGVVDQSAAEMSFGEFSRQFLEELNYEAEQEHLHETWESSQSAAAPYKKRGVAVPRVYKNLSTSKVITMSYLRGPKLEEEARRQLAMLGIDTNKGLARVVRDAAQRSEDDAKLVESELEKEDTISLANSDTRVGWKVKIGEKIGQLIGFDTALWMLRVARRLFLWSTAVTASTVGYVAPVLPQSWNEWSQEHRTAYQQMQRLNLTKDWIEALLDVHGYQIFQQGLFNADCHPGNILVLEDEDGHPTTNLGLIDYGQCKRLTPDEQVRVARLILSVARKESDEEIAAAFRNMNVQTKNNSTEFLAEIARLMFDSFQTHHLNHSFHHRLHRMDRITYFPKELSMVYRTSLLLRGLGASLQMNVSVSEQWQQHAQAAVEKYGDIHFESQAKSKAPVIHEEEVAGVSPVAPSLSGCETGKVHLSTR